MCSYLHVNMYTSIHVNIAKLACSVCCTTLAILAKQSLTEIFAKLRKSNFTSESPPCASLIRPFFFFSGDACLADDGVPHFVILLASGSTFLLSSCDLFSFFSPAPSGFVSVPDSGLRSSFWASLLFPPYPNWYMMVENHQRRYLLF